MKFKKSFVDLFKISREQENNTQISENLPIILSQKPLSGEDSNNIEKTISELHPNLYSQYIGLGNPNSNILIIGHELGFESSKPFPMRATKHWTCPYPNTNYYKMLHLNEVILNYNLWLTKISGHSIIPNCNVQDPEFPPSFCNLFNKEKIRSHTWGLINQIISFHESFPFHFNAVNLSDSFFQHCFLTELNLVPASKSAHVKKNYEAVSDRFNYLLSTSFYQDFQTIIFSCATYLKTCIPDYQSKIKEAYGVTNTPISHYPNIRNIKQVFTNESGKKIIVTNQLSGSCFWRTSELKLLASLIYNNKN